MKLILSMRNVRHGQKVGKPVEEVIKLFKKKFIKKLKKNIDDNKNLDYKVKDLIDGFNIIIFGDKELVQEEYNLVDKEFKQLESKKTGQMGLNALTYIGLSFNYYITE